MLCEKNQNKEPHSQVEDPHAVTAACGHQAGDTLPPVGWRPNTSVTICYSTANAVVLVTLNA